MKEIVKVTTILCCIILGVMITCDSLSVASISVSWFQRESEPRLGTDGNVSVILPAVNQVPVFPGRLYLPPP